MIARDFEIHEDSGLSVGSLTDNLRVFDLHCDTLDRLGLHGSTDYEAFAPQDVVVPHVRMSSLADNDAHISLDRLEPYSWCQCFAVFVPDTLQGLEAWRFFEYIKAYFDSQMQAHAGRIVQIRDARNIEAALMQGKVAALLTIEGGSFLKDSLEHVVDIAEAGVKMLTLTWNGENALGSGNDTRHGLSVFGKRAIGALENQKIVVDVSHLNDVGFSDVCDIATRPFAASHSNARVVCGHKRNLTNAQIRAIADSGGIIGLNYCTEFLSSKHSDPTCDDVLHHIDRIMEKGGEDVLALGSDYDGCDVPSWLSSADKVSNLQNLIVEHFGFRIAEKVFFENAQQFFVNNETM